MDIECHAKKALLSVEIVDSVFGEQMLIVDKRWQLERMPETPR